jgi:hypothetical protein
MRWILLALVIALSACTKKKAGQACERGHCSDGLICDAPAPVVCRTCADSYRCQRDGLCAYRDGSCYARNEQDCKASSHCTKQGYCSFVPKDGTCVNERGVTHWDGDHEGGCPCGCDHSEEMIASLHEQTDQEALGAARRSITTIGEREQAGYITEAMVTHRLRLRQLEAELSPNPLALSPAPHVERRRAARGRLPLVAAGELSVRQELLVFGDTTERVNGRDKDLTACFRWWLSIENTGPVKATLAMPVVLGSRSLELGGAVANTKVVALGRWDAAR